MRLRSFHGSTLTDAMRQVREALGEEAIIVATRDDDMGGVRVTAAMDDTAYTAHSPPPSSPSPPVTPQSTTPDALEHIAESMTRHAVPAHLAERLMATATQMGADDPLLALGTALDTHFGFSPITIDERDVPIVLIGPPGAGKTLTIAKLATRAALAKQPLMVISTDFSRAGGIEQLAAFTRLLGIQLVESEDAHALRDAIDMAQDKLVLIDTAGGNPYDQTERTALEKTIQAAGGTAILTLPTGLDAAEAIEMANQFKKLGASRLLPTRLDMTRRLGGLLRLAAETGLPFCNATASMKVTEPPLPLNPIALARLILPPETTDLPSNDQKGSVL